MAGSLFSLPWASPLNTGVVMPGAKLFFYIATTTTKQNTYTTSALSVAHANPVVADGSGRSAAIWLDPALTYKYVLTTSGDSDPPVAAVLTEDNVPVVGAVYSEGSFTGTLTGYASGPTGTVSYKIFANPAGTGKLCTLHIKANITGTSNATALTMAGLPSAVRPVGAVSLPCLVTDNAVLVIASVSISASGSTIVFGMGAGFSSTGFTNSGTKGLIGGWQITYAL